MRLPIDNITTGVEESRRPGAWYLMLKEMMYDNHKKAQSNIEVSKKRQKRNFDKKCKSQHFEVDDAVWLHRPQWSEAGKLGKPWVGPYRVLEVLSPSNYRLRWWGRQEGGTVVVHHDQLKRCVDPERAISQRRERCSYVHGEGEFEAESDDQECMEIVDDEDCSFEVGEIGDEGVEFSSRERVDAVDADWSSESDESSDEEGWWVLSKAAPPCSALSPHDSTSSDDTLPMIASPRSWPRPTRIPAPDHHYNLRPRSLRRPDRSQEAAS